MEKEKRAREADRAVSKQKGKRRKGSDVQVDKHSDGSTGQNSNPEKTVVLYRGENADGCVIGAPKTGLFGTTATWVPSTDYPEQK